MKQSKAAMDKGTVRLTKAHLGLIPGMYDSDGVNLAGDVILIDAVRGRINVPLDKIEIVKPAKSETKSASRETKQPKSETPVPAKGKPSEKQDSFIKNDDKPFYIDPYGQMTINKIDTPIGKLAQRIIQAQLDIRRLEEQMTEDEDVMMKEMKTQKVTKITVLGHRLVYQEAKTTAAKLIVKDLD